MRRRTIGLLAVALVTVSAPLAAQGVARGERGAQGARVRAQGQGMAMARMQAPARGAEFLLAHAGELQLTDQQVVRLAQIARRTAERRQAMRERMAAAAPVRAMRGPGMRGQAMRGQAAQPADSATRAARMQQMQARRDSLRTAMQQRRDEVRADLQAALDVLTPEQRARAFELVSRRGGRR